MTRLVQAGFGNSSQLNNELLKNIMYPLLSLVVHAWQMGESSSTATAVPLTTLPTTDLLPGLHTCAHCLPTDYRPASRPACLCALCNQSAILVHGECGTQALAVS